MKTHLQLRRTCTVDLLLWDYVLNVNTPDSGMSTKLTHLNQAILIISLCKQFIITRYQQLSVGKKGYTTDLQHANTISTAISCLTIITWHSKHDIPFKLYKYDSKLNIYCIDHILRQNLHDKVVW